MFAAAAARTVLVAASALLFLVFCIAGAAGGAANRDRTPPAPPTNLRVASATESTVQVAWDAASDDVGVTGYVVTVGREKVTVDEETYALDKLGCGVGTIVKVAAVDEAKNRSEDVSLTVATAACVDTQAPSKPTGFVQTQATQNAVMLSWAPSTDDHGVVSYGVYQGLLPADPTTEPSTVLDGLACGFTYAVWVDAVDAAGNRSARGTTYVQTASCSQPTRDTTPPAKPVLSMGPITATSADLRWQPGVDNVGIDHYNVWLGSNLVTQTKSLSYTYSGLTCNTSYSLGLEAVDAAGNKSNLTQARWTVRTAACASAPPATDTTPPAKPVLSMGPITATSADLRWQPGVDNVGIDHYNVWLGSNLVTQTKSLSYTYSGLTCNTSYSLGLEAVDAAGNKSNLTQARWTVRTAACASAPPATDTTPPAKPVLSMGPITATSADLRWQPGVDNVGIDHYNVWLGSNLVTQTKSLSYTYSGLTCNTSYSLGLEAVDAAGNKSNLTQARWTVRTAACASAPPATDTTPPSTPKNVAIVSSAPSKVALSWSASTDNVGVEAYGVSRNDVHLFDAPQVGASVTGLACGTAYSFAVDAHDAAGNQSDEATVIGSTAACSDSQPPTAPANVVTSARTATSIALSWGPSTDNVGVTEYGSYRNGTATGAGPGTTAIFSNLACDTNYTLGVDASDAAGNRSPVTTVMVSTTACPDATAPTAPTGLTFSSVTQTGGTLAWSASRDNVAVSGYDVFRDGTATASVGTTTSNQSGLTCGTSYSFVVIARDAAGNASWPAQLNASTSACPTSPSDTTPPANPVLSLGPITATSAELRWQPGVDNVGIDHYNVWLGSNLVTQTKSLSYTYSGLTCNTSYSLGLEAVDAAGNKSNLAQARWTIQTAACVASGSPPAATSGQVLFNGDLETGNDSQYSAINRYTADRFRVTGAVEGVSPRQGNYMARVECRQGEAAPWSSVLCASLAEKHSLQVGYNQAITDTYMGWSVYVPANYPWASSSMHSIMAEWHGQGSMSQAPFHFGILGNGGNAGHFFIDLHRAASGYSPVFQPAFEALSAPGMANRWINCVVRILWSQSGNGRLQFWMDGNLKYDYTGPTAPVTGENIKPIVGLYADDRTPDKKIYVDGFKVGTSYASVAP